MPPTIHPLLKRQYATIDTSASLSGAVDLEGRVIVGIVMPPVWTAANLTFQGSADNNTFMNVYDTAGSERVVNAAADRFITVDSNVFIGVNFVKIRSGTGAAPVPQTAPRTIVLMTRSL